MNGTVGTAVVVAAVVPLVLGWLMKSRAVTPNTLAYSTTVKVFGLVVMLAPPLLVVAALVLQPAPLKPEDVGPLVGIIVMFAALGGPLALEFFRVQHQFDAEGITFRSPWSTERRLAWRDVTALKWRPQLKWLDLHGAPGLAPLHLSPMLGGLQPFAELVLQRLPPEVLAASPEGRRALELMAKGQAGALLGA